MSNKAIMLAAPSSGSGKTLITCGILQALKNRGLKVASFKCGPDYIDPMFHRRAIGIEASNIDLFFCQEDMARSLFEENSKDMEISIVEGVMGYYDGMSAATEEGSSYDVSRTLGIPTVMIINAKGQSLSAMAVLKGISEFREDSNIVGVIFNNMSKHVYDSLKEEVKKLKGIQPLGYLPNSKDLVIESRHLGLITPMEIKNLTVKLNKLADTIEESVELDKLLELAKGYEPSKTAAPQVQKVAGTTKIAIARDEAFCFYYKDNINLLKKMGADIVEFSPVHDDKLPENIDGLILGGGYPELYHKELLANANMKESIKKAISDGMPCLAECGGFLYLHQKMEDIEGNSAAALGLIEGNSFRTQKLNRFGYITLEANEDNWLMEKGETIKGHEFHYFDSENCGSDLTAIKPITGKSWQCMHIKDRLAVGFPHLFYHANPNVPKRFLEVAMKYAKERSK